VPGKIFSAPAASNPDKDAKAPEDTEEEDSSDTEDADAENQEQGEEEESDDSEDTEDTDEEEEGTEDTKEESDKQYIDLKSVPPQLQIAAKKMLASHTKAMQKVSTKVEEQVATKMEELNNAYSQVLVKAGGFDKITQLPAWEQFWDDMQNGREYGYSSRFRANGKTEPEVDASAASEGKVSVESIVKQLTPAIRKMIESEVGPIKKDHAKTLWDAAEKLPNFKLYKAKVTEIMLKHPTLSLEEAYEMAGGRKEALNKVIKEDKEIIKKLPRTLKPGSGGGSGKPLSEKTVNSIEDALNLASRDLATRGG
jgi:hypothetical protein